jgi:(p)ppGpp synthase/HD superfamily hydrolase
MRGERRIPRARPKTVAALEYAERAHVGQRRAADGAAFIVHPREVAWLLDRAGAPDHLVAAGALHDVVEKTGVEADELRARFGPSVARLVAAVTEDEQIDDYAARKAALRDQVAGRGAEALELFAADKISKVRELGLERARPNGRPSRRQRLAHYRASLRLLEERIPDSPLVQRLRAELDSR